MNLLRQIRNPLDSGNKGNSGILHVLISAEHDAPSETISVSLTVELCSSERLFLFKLSAWEIQLLNLLIIL